MHSEHAAFRREEHGAWSARAVSCLILLISLSATLCVHRFLQQNETAQALESFRLQNQRIEGSFEQRFASFESILKSAAGIVDAAHGKVHPAFWASYVSAINPQTTYPGITALGYAVFSGTGPPVVEALSPAAPSSRGRVAKRLGEVLNVTSLEAGGFLLEHWDETDDFHADFVLVLPVQDLSDSGPGAPVLPEVRVVFALIHMQQLMRGVVADSGGDLAVRVLEKSAVGSQDSLLFSIDRLPGRRPPVFREQIGFMPGGKFWQLELSSTESSERFLRRSASDVALVAGLAISMLLTALAWYLARLRHRAERRAEEITRELSLSERRFELAMQATRDGIWDRNVLTGECYLSPRVAEMLGETSADHHFRFDSFVLYEDRSVWDSLYLGGNAGAEPMAREFRVRHRSGEVLWLRAMAITVCNADGRVVRVIGALTDISEAKLAEAQLIHHRNELQEQVRLKTQDLRFAKEAAEKANEAKTVFLSHMSHELRSPMHAILSFARLGQQKAGSAERDKLQRYFVAVVESGERLLVLLNDLLDLSRLEAGKMQMYFEGHDLVLLVRSMLAEMEALADARSVNLDLQCTTTQVRLRCDGQRVGQVVCNLLSNAIKFSPEGSCVTILIEDGTLPSRNPDAVNHPRHGVRLKVLDEGCGIPEGEQESIFENYVQSSLTSSAAGGTGLGLAICREILAAHRGSIRGYNRPTAGACFEVLLPLDPDE